MTDKTTRQAERAAEIYRLRGELQTMESCLANGCTFQDYIDTHKRLIEILTSLEF